MQFLGCTSHISSAQYLHVEQTGHVRPRGRFRGTGRLGWAGLEPQFSCFLALSLGALLRCSVPPLLHL